MNAECKAKEDAEKLFSRLNEVRHSADRRATGARNELIALQSDYQQLLVDVELARRPASDKAQARERISELELLIAEAPALIAGLDREIAACRVNLVRAQRLVNDRDEYETAKREIKEVGLTPRLKERLCGLARKLNTEADAEAFITEQLEAAA